MVDLKYESSDLNSFQSGLPQEFGDSGLSAQAAELMDLQGWQSHSSDDERSRSSANEEVNAILSGGSFFAAGDGNENESAKPSIGSEKTEPEAPPAPDARKRALNEKYAQEIERYQNMNWAEKMWSNVGDFGNELKDGTVSTGKGVAQTEKEAARTAQQTANDVQKTITKTTNKALNEAEQATQNAAKDAEKLLFNTTRQQNRLFNKGARGAAGAATGLLGNLPFNKK